MPDYSKCIIYTIRTPTGLYVGSTCNFTNRKYNHNRNIHNENDRKYNFKLYKNIRENNDEWEMKPYNEFPCENKTQMVIEEERVRRELNADLNSKSCYGFNKEKNAEYMKQYRKNNKEKIIQQKKEYNLKHRKEYYQKNKEKISETNKKYQMENKEKIKQNKKIYYQKNKEKLLN